MPAIPRSLAGLAAQFAPPRAALWLQGEFLQERERWLLWVPVLLACGIGLYFALPSEPATWLPLAVAGSLLALLVLLWRRDGARIGLTAALLVAAGCALAQWRAQFVAAPVLDRQIGPVAVSGRVLNAQAREDGVRLTLERLTIARIAPERTPERVRVTAKLRGAPPPVGSWVSVRAVLMPPAQPAVPGAFDFARTAWFDRLGGIGYSVAAPRLIAAPSGEGAGTWSGAARLWINGVRQTLTARILAALPGPAGAIAAALMTGERSAIPPEVDAAWRDSGLAHILSISGLHLALVAGIVFGGLRALLALWPWLALNHPIKKWAAVAALLATFCYMLLSGADTPTQRSFLMTALILLAVLVDRTAISMRSVAWAALAILVIAPEALLNAGFQMSFAAVAALIAAYEVIGRRLAARSDDALPRRALMMVAGAAATSLIAGMATAPFAAYHFNRFVDFGLVANLLAVPLASFWVMPWAVIAFLLMPLGLEAWALVPMGWGIEGINHLATMVASWPGSVSLIPAMPVWSLAAMALGGVWLVIWRRRWRLAGLVPMLAGMASPFLTPVPSLFIHPDGAVAVRMADGALAIGGGGGIVAETWLRRVGRETAAPWPGERDLTPNRNGRLARRGAAAPVQSADGRLRCDGLGCTFRTDGWLIAFPRDPGAAAEDCRSADLVLTHLFIRDRCPSARLLVDRNELRRNGAHAVYLGSNTIRVEHVAGSSGARLWNGGVR
jgi:competence protein ComEC